MSAHEFAEWLAYFQLEPFGDERADLRMAILASLIANANRDPKKRSKAFEPKDFMPKFDEVQATEGKREQTWEEQLTFVKMLNEAFGGKDLRQATQQ